MANRAVRFMVYNTTFNNILATMYIVAFSFIDGGKQSIWKKPPNCHKLLTNFIT